MATRKQTLSYTTYYAMAQARDRAPLTAMAHVSPALRESQLSAEEWDRLLVEFLTSTPE